MNADPYEGHSQNCAAVRPGDNECNCHIAYGFSTQEEMDEASMRALSGINQNLNKLGSAMQWLSDYAVLTGETEYYQTIAAILRSMEEAQAVACPYCDDTGDVHSIDGEWRGKCTSCHPPAESGEAKDAARYRYLLTCIDADFGPSLVWACDWSREYGSQLIVDSGQSEANFVSAIDAAMTAESREKEL